VNRFRFARAVVPLLAVLAAAPAAAFDFAGFVFDDAGTPDLFTPLPVGLLASGQGVVVTAISTNTGIDTNFPNPPTFGFDVLLTVGVLAGASPDAAQAYLLPAGNDGTVARSGFELAWSGGRALRNQAGDDFVVFQNGRIGTPDGGIDGFMVQVRDLASGTWSRWRFESADVFALFQPPQDERGAYATGFDLTYFQIAPGAFVDRIRLVNLTDEDRVTDANRQGTVLPDDGGATSALLPDPGPAAPIDTFGAGSLDPDILYVAVLSSVVYPVGAADDDEGPGTPDPPPIADFDEFSAPN
jgi:hypothetical protein